MTALVPSETACFESSPGSMRRTAVWISRDESVAFFEKRHSLDAYQKSHRSRKVNLALHQGPMGRECGL